MKLVILIGPPGSGKTTHAILHHVSYGFARISQDMHEGDRKRTMNTYQMHIDSKYDIVLDRCNMSKKQRKEWIKIAKDAGYTIEAVQLVVPREVCVERMMTREGHETIPNTMDPNKMEDIVRSFNQDLEPPTLDEGFSKITIMRND